MPDSDKRSRKRDLRALPALGEMPSDQLERLIRALEEEMHEAAVDLRFEYAARLRDEVAALKKELKSMEDAPA